MDTRNADNAAPTKRPFISCWYEEARRRPNEVKSSSSDAEERGEEAAAAESSSLSCSSIMQPSDQGLISVS